LKRDIGELYCALQLATHARNDPIAREAVAVVIRDARTAAQSQSGKTQLTFSVLLLRLLTLFHGEQLRDVIEDTLWERSGNAKDHSAQQQLLLHEQGLKRILQSHFEVQLGRREMLAEGTTRRVYRQHFRYQFGIRFASDSAQHDMPLDVIVKQDKLPALLRAAQSYNNLAETLKPLFALHGQPETIDGKPDGVWLLLMHDLQGYRTLSQSLDDLDRRRRLLPSEQIKIDQLLRNLTRGLRTLHSHSQPTRQDVHDLDNEYLAPLHRQWGALSHNAFPRLRQLMYGDFRVNDQPFKVLGHYLSALRQAQAKLRRDNHSLSASRLGLVHGDCHSRNLMLNDAGDLKFIDLESLEDAQDYLRDYAILFEDVGMYRYAAETDMEQEFSGKSNGNHRAGKYPAIHYAPFAPSPFAHAFQQQLMEHLRAYAQEIQDKLWKPRLWLATASALTLLSSRRFSHAHQTQHTPEQEKLAILLYTETIRLLDQLVSHLKTNIELPDIPFPGASRLG
jgi:thiamine kinase-like enzyme